MQYQLVSENGIHIAGSMQGWNPSSTPLSDANGDNIWEVTFNISRKRFTNTNSLMVIHGEVMKLFLEIVVQEMVIDKFPTTMKICHYQHMFLIPAT